MTKAAPTNYQRDSEHCDGQPQRHASPEVRQFPACIGQALDEQVLQSFLDSKREGIPPNRGLAAVRQIARMTLLRFSLQQNEL